MPEYGEHEFSEAYDAWREENYDPDAPIAYWPDDEALANFVETDRLEELDGHA